MNCICGCTSFKEEVKQGFVTDPIGNSVEAAIPIAVCDSCGMARQIELPFSNEKEYDEYYANNYPPGNKEYAPRGYACDLDNAKKTFTRLKLSNSKRLLDIGCGSGALVDFCRQKGIEAYGCELLKYHYAPDNPNIYYRKFEDIHFPTDHFDTIVCCDVVEHVIDPIGFIKEIFRILSIGGTCHIEIPLFFHKDGKAHWKRIEHVWYFKPEQFEKLLSRVGFKKVGIIAKEETKTVFVVTKPEQSRVSILLPPGIGDVYWPLIKTEAFLKREGITAPVDAYVAAPRAKEFDSHKRAFPFLEMFPFLHSTGEVKFSHPKDPIWKNAYLREAGAIFEGVLGCDYFITWNGYLRAGKSLEEVDPDLTCNWFLPRFVSLREEAYRMNSIAKYGKYLVLYWVFTGTNGSIFDHISLREIAASVCKIVEETKLTPILVGAAWDVSNRHLDEFKLSLPKNTVDLRGKTNVEEIFGLIRGSQAVVGMNSGITIMSGVFGVKTILLYHKYLFTDGVDRNFAWNTFPPSVRSRTYFAEFADRISWEGFADRAISVIKGTAYVEKSTPIKVVEPKVPLIRNTTEGVCASIRDLEVDDAMGVVEGVDITVACVLKSGGDFTADHVEKLRNMVARNMTLPYDFVCLTDMNVPKNVCRSIRLQNGFPGWWSKVELFRKDLFKTKYVVYFDLDTVITGSIDSLFVKDIDFAALRPWNERNRNNGYFASGMLIWKNGNYDFIYDEFDENTIGDYTVGDQQYMSNALTERDQHYYPIQSYFDGVYSYKRNCKGSLPKGARIVCFHGHPRPSEVVGLPGHGWVERNWR
jgi:SAM-dependent methyltransferase